MKNDSLARAWIVALAGLLVFCVGAALRFQASRLSGRMLGNGFPSSGAERNSRVEFMTQANALEAVGVPLLWLGGALLVLAAWVFLLPVWRVGRAQ